MVRGLTRVCAVVLWGATVTFVSAQTQEFIVDITDSGFATPSLEINVGDTVVWRNNDSVAHWPASNLHPSHALYSEFDPLAPIAPGAEWRFTFDRAGEWRFHDHLYPARGGVILVHGTSTDVAESSHAPSRLVSVLALIHRFLPGWVLNRLSFETITDIVTNIATKDSPEAALVFIHERLDGVSDLTGAAVHGLKHIVGQALYERDGLEGLIVCTINPDSAVDGACYHGVMEAFFVAQSIDRALDSSEFEHLCTPWITRNDCLNIFHGIGHGYASFVGLDLEKALELCTHLEVPVRISSCMTGVNMEWSESIPFGQIAMLRSDPWGLCSRMHDARFQLLCAFEMPRLFSFLNEGRQNINFDMYENSIAIREGCESAPSADFRELCVQGAGFMASIRSTPAHSVAALCREMATESADVRLCLIAGAQRLALMNQPEFKSQLDDVCAVLRDTYAWATCYELPPAAPSRELLGVRSE